MAFGKPLKDASLSKLKTVGGNQIGWVYPTNGYLLLAISIKHYKQMQDMSKWKNYFMGESGPTTNFSKEPIKRLTFEKVPKLCLEGVYPPISLRSLGTFGSMKMANPKPEKEYQTQIHKTDGFINSYPLHPFENNSTYFGKNGKFQYYAQNNPHKYIEKDYYKFRPDNPWGKDTPKDYEHKKKLYWPDEGKIIMDVNTQSIDALLERKQKIGFSAAGLEWLVLAVSLPKYNQVTSFSEKVIPIEFYPSLVLSKPCVDFCGILNWLCLTSDK